MLSPSPSFLFPFCFFLIGFSLSAFAQTRNELQQNRKQLLKEIKITSNLLSQTSKNKNAALVEYTTLQKQIKTRKKLVNTLKLELQQADIRINRTTEVIESMEEDIIILKEEYNKMLRNAFRQKLSNSTLWFLFSADSFNQAIQRWRYIKQYEHYRKRQADLILKTKYTLAEKVAALEESKKEKTALLNEQQAQQNKLAKELERRNKILRSLRRDEKHLKSELRKQRIAHEKMNQAIEGVIHNEMRSRRKNSRSETALNSNNNANISKRLTGSFSKNKGLLPWPVKDGVITKWFGKQQHPTLPRVMITNNGIDIRSTKNASVSAVFDGVVASKQFVPGYNNMLIIRHGNYYTVYSNLDAVFVKKGDKITIGQQIGQASTNQNSNLSEVHFEIWHDKVRLNPSDWIKHP
ncbi:MAG TPA: hypothetical protein ENK52_02740 [Saprospiraceae bacterium]|nr:hypothetical protein [Saprospiraceae bacterium]